MKILFIFTGGTIASTKRGDYISTDKTKPYSILSTYDKKHAIDFEYDAFEPYSILSENATGEHLKLLYDIINSNLTAGYDGIIVTHGTDTLQYSSSAISYGVGLCNLPIIFVSSNYPLENPNANGIDNLHGAIEFIKNKLGKGVFVSYKNDNTVTIHRATRLLPSMALSDKVNSLCASVYGEFSKDFIFTKSPLYIEKPDQTAPLTLDNLGDYSEEILWINAYAGMPYPKLSKSIKCVLISAYHSGTINTESARAVEFFRLAKEMGIKVFVCGITKGISYQSSACFSEFNVIPIYDISPISAYVKLWILSSQGKDLSLINSSLSADVI